MNYLHRVQGIVILDETGQRVFAKYYADHDSSASAKDLLTFEQQRRLESLIHNAVRDPRRSSGSSIEGDIMLIDGHAILFALGGDVTFVVVGDGDENELVLFTVLKTLVDALKEELDTVDLRLRQLCERYDAVLLTVDEMLDDGIILETSASAIASEVEPYIAETGSDRAHKVISAANKYLQDNL